jgi:hypothetical protein
LQKNLEISLVQLRDDIFGDLLVLAYSPGPADKPDKERGLLLLEARNPERLAKILDRLLALQKESGEVTRVQEQTLGRHKYLMAVRQRETNFYLRSGAILAVTSDESVLRDVIARLDNPAAQSIFKDRFPSLDSAGRIVSLWLNPKPYRALLERQIGLVKGAQLAALQTFLRYWNALDCVGLFITHRDDCEITFAVEGRLGELPPGGSNMLFKPPAPTNDLAGRWPPEAFLTLTRSIDLPGTLVGVSEFMDLATRQQLQSTFEQKASALLGQDVVGEALPTLGPEWGGCIAAPPSMDAAWFPHMLAAVRIHATTAEPAPELHLMNTLNSLANLAVFAQNQVRPGSMSLRSRVHDGTEIRYLANDKEFPPGLLPAFACRGGYLVLGSSPAAIVRFAPHRPDGAHAEGPFFQVLFRPLVTYLRERQDVLATYQAAHNGVTQVEAKARLERLTALVELLNRFEIASRPLPNGLALSLRLQFAAPLR